MQKIPADLGEHRAIDLAPQLALFVLGMHRSGTSALAGLLHLLGFHLGDNLFPADAKVNARGYWENADFVDIHERVLESIGSSWSDDRNLPDQWWSTPEMEAFRKETEEALDRLIDQNTWLAVKDPRLCRLMPLWRPILVKKGIRAYSVLIIRDPQEVAESLAKRDGICTERACLLWLQHLIDTERCSETDKRLHVTYDDLLCDWRRVVADIENVCGITSMMPNQGVASDIDAFISNELKHHKSQKDASGPIETLSVRLYQEFISSNRQDFWRAIRRAAGEIEGFLRMAEPWSTEIQALRRNVSELSGERELKEQMIREIARIKSTVSWRITAPLRVIANAWGKLAR